MNTTSGHKQNTVHSMFLTVYVHLTLSFTLVSLMAMVCLHSRMASTLLYKPPSRTQTNGHMGLDHCRQQVKDSIITIKCMGHTNNANLIVGAEVISAMLHTQLRFKQTTLINKTYPVLFASITLGNNALKYAQVQISSSITMSRLWKLNTADCTREKRQSRITALQAYYSSFSTISNLKLLK